MVGSDRADETGARSTDPLQLLAAARSLHPLQAHGLPIFRRACGGYVLYYAPGCVCVADRPDAAGFEAAIGAGGDGDAPQERWGRELRRRAALAAAETGPLREPFCPECLTLYLSNECNLHCTYCYSGPSAPAGARLELSSVGAAADLVAGNCRRRSLPLHVVLHGGGEPTRHWALMESVLALVEATAQRHGVGLQRYVATNGVVSEKKAAWLARRFDLVGLSCDGPPDIQDGQRPDRCGGATSPAVERTARILREEGRPFHVRSTITPDSVHRQAEIADYVCRRLGPVEIRFEPATRRPLSAAFCRPRRSLVGTACALRTLAAARMPCTGPTATSFARSSISSREA